MSKEKIRAIKTTMDVGIHGVPHEPGAVLLVPEDIHEDTARSLMRMTRPRAEVASESETKTRLAEYKKEQAERRKLDEEAQAEAEALAAEQASEAAKELAAAKLEAAEIISKAKKQADEIIAAAKK